MNEQEQRSDDCLGRESSETEEHVRGWFIATSAGSNRRRLQLKNKDYCLKYCLIATDNLSNAQERINLRWNKEV